VLAVPDEIPERVAHHAIHNERVILVEILRDVRREPVEVPSDRRVAHAVLAGQLRLVEPQRMPALLDPI
jgi:hypothetical protein